MAAVLTRKPSQRTHVSAGTLISAAWLTLLVGGGRLIFSLVNHWRSWQPSPDFQLNQLEDKLVVRPAGNATARGGCDITSEDIMYWAAIGLAVAVALGVGWMYWHWRGYWNSACDKAFAIIDVDGSGTVDQAELEMGVILVYGEINKYVRVARPNRAEIQRFLDCFDHGRDGELNHLEFRRCMFAMGPTVAFRTATMLLVTCTSPFLADYVCACLGNAMFMVSRVGFVKRFLAEQGLGAKGCTMTVAQQALPFLNKDLAETFLSLAIVMVIVPKLFDSYDAWGLQRAPAHSGVGGGAAVSSRPRGTSAAPPRRASLSRDTRIKEK